MPSFSPDLAAGLRGLVSPYGVVAEVKTGMRLPGLPGLSLASALVGGAPGIDRPEEFAGSGRSLSGPEPAWLTAIAEGAERYAGADFTVGPEVWAAEAELDGPVLDMAALPRCSRREYDSGHCPVTPYRPEARIRWVRGVDLESRTPVWVPAVMARFGMRHLAEGERFWNRVSTGYAVHADPAEAILRGLCEVAERDAAALVWLQMPPLPRLTFDSPPPGLRELLRHGDRHFLQTRFFDATTGLGVPTVYCVQLSAYDDACAQLAGCSAGRDLTEAATRALLECLPGRSLFHREDATGHALIMDGAAEMGRRDRRDGFAFLLDDAPGRPVHGPDARPALPADPKAALDLLIRALSERGMRAVAVDRTTRELRAAGLTAVCVTVPALQPLTFHRYGQYRAHPRLYSGPREMGFTSRAEEELNPWPQPLR